MRKLGGNVQVLREREINPLKEYLTNTILVIIEPKHVDKKIKFW
jgi:hypothetical protein